MTLGVDFGNGAAVYFNGELHETWQSDLWWAYNWKNRDIIVIKYDYQPSEEVQLITLYGHEGGNDGQQNIRHQFKNVRKPEKQSIKCYGIVRDFSVDHPDMNVFSFGKVGNNLVDGKMVLQDGYSGAAWFDSWYNNMENINLPKKIEFTLR